MGRAWNRAGQGGIGPRWGCGLHRHILCLASGWEAQHRVSLVCTGQIDRGDSSTPNAESGLYLGNREECPFPQGEPVDS